MSESLTTNYISFTKIVGMSAARVLIEEKRRSLTGFSQEPPINTRLEQAQSLLNRAKDALRKCSGTAENYAIFCMYKLIYYGKKVDLKLLIP